MCICINCKFVDRCQAYRFVEEKHSQPFVSQNPDFMPRDGTPKMQVPWIDIFNVFTRVIDFRQVFIRKEGDAQQAQPTAGTVAEGSRPVSPLSTTIEYDVFECDDFGEQCIINSRPTCP